MTDRVVQTFRCTNDYRAIARIIVRDKQRILLVPGGRYGHTSSLRESLEGAADRIRRGVDTSLLQRVDPDALEYMAARVDVEPQIIPPDEYPLPPYVQLLGDRHGEEVLHGPVDAVCPQCHRATRLKFVIRDDGGCDVLESDA